MRVVDLTLAIAATGRQKRQPDSAPEEVAVVRTAEWVFPDYTARVHYFNHWGMAGTYLDLPGHIVQTDDGRRADNVPAAAFFRRPADVFHLDRADRPGGVTAAELAAVAPPGEPARAAIVNALGARRFDSIGERAIWLDRGALEWLLDRGMDLLVSDVYESNSQPQGIFPRLFGAGAACVCCPVNLHELTAPRVLLTALPLRLAEATQLPCRLLAEMPDGEDQ